MNRVVAGLLVVAVIALPVLAADNPLTIRWLGQSSFVLTTSQGTRVAFDPHALEPYGKQTAAADLVLISHFHPDHVRVDVIEQRDKAKIIHGLKPPADGNPARAAWNPVDETFKDVRV